MKKYNFTYDNMDRLVTANYSANNSNSEAYRYNVSIGYNANSSITDILRSGKRNSGYGYIDALSYTYEGNQLKSITDHILATYTLYEGASDFKDKATLDVEYVYDSCGSVIQDKNKEISLIEYDYNGMPIRIQFLNGSITEYVYAADGTKLRTIHRKSVPGIYVLYGNSEDLTPSQTLSVDSTTYIGSLEIDQYFNSKYYYGNGYIALGNAGGGTYHYMVSDHLGNTRAVVNSSGTVEQVNNYYPYGGLLNDVTYTTDVQNHKYNGKEYDSMHGLNEYDYGARRYDPVIGMFTSMDPLCEKYYYISPYSYCGGNPISRVDPDGEDWYEFEGRRIWQNSVEKTYIDEKGNEWKNIGHTYTDSKTGMYYSLFGQKCLAKDKSQNQVLNVIKEVDGFMIESAKFIVGAQETQPEANFNFPFDDRKGVGIEKYKHTLSYGGDAENVVFYHYTAHNIGKSEKLMQPFTEYGYFSKSSAKGILIRNKNNLDLFRADFSDRTWKKVFSFYEKLKLKYIK